MRICFDLDGTICTAVSDYETAVPFQRVVSLMQALSEQGHTIVIQTARGMGSSNQNPGAARAKYAALTFRQLEEWGVPYNEIYFGKPGADYYFDDKGFNAVDMYAKIERIIQAGEGHGRI